MGLRVICEKGYPLSVCRCRKEHTPFLVQPCPPNHAHRGLPMDANGQALRPEGGAVVVCPRCGEAYTHLHGGVCGFCADELERLNADA